MGDGNADSALRGTSYITWEDAQQMPEDGRRHEAIGGELYGTPLPSIRHQRICHRICMEMSDIVGDRGEVVLGPVGVVFPATEEGVQPDLLCVSLERRHILADPWILGAPDLVVEVSSAVTGERDRGVKRDLYERQGVAEYWIVDPDAESVEVWSFGEAGPAFARHAERVPVRLAGEEFGAIDLGRVFGGGTGA